MDKEEKKEVQQEGEGSNKVEDLIGEGNQTTPTMREIIIETDGSLIRLKKAEAASKIELIAILQNLINFLNQQDKNNKRIS